ncbi:MAG: hypothetical protein Q9166_004109 [cf. Caloplaca sp. 2 TL-2023]
MLFSTSPAIFIYISSIEAQKPQMPTSDNPENKASKHDPTALIDLHPSPSPLKLPETLPLPLKLISLVCPSNRRRAPQRHPTCSLSPAPTPDPIYPSSSSPPPDKGGTTYTSFPPPTFHHNGQPRALDSRLYPDLTTCSAAAAHRQKLWKQQLRAEGARWEKEEVEERRRFGEVERKTERDRRPRRKVTEAKTDLQEFKVPILKCPYSPHHRIHSPPPSS